VVLIRYGVGDREKEDFMSEGFAAPPPPSAPAPRKRPATVTIAGILLLVVALTALIYLVASFAALPDLTTGFEEAYADTELADMAGVLAAFTVIAGVVYLLFGITLAILTVFNNQGRNGARITTWVVGGIALCCGGLSLLGTALGDATAGMGQQDPDLPDTEEVVEIIAQYQPAWFEPVTITSNVVGVLALAAALLLLALPPSNEFFRKPEPQFEPPGYPPVG
jgi:small-conductance mechanosensitive channel